MLTEHQEAVDPPPLRAGLVAAWPVLARMEKRLVESKSFQRVRAVWQHKVFQRALKSAIVLTFLAFIGLSVYKNWNELQSYDWRMDTRYLIAAIVLFPAAYLPTAWCWHHLVRRVSGFDDARANAHIFFMSSLGRYMPGVVWYIAGRAYWYGSHRVPATHVVISTLWENVIFVTSGLVIYGLFGWDWPPVAALLGGGAVMIYAALGNRLLAGAQVKMGIPPLGRVGVRDQLALLGALAIAWVAGGLLLWMVANAIYPVELATLPALTAAWGLAGAVSVVAGVLVAGLGIRELTLGALLAQLVPAPVAIVVALLFRLVLTVSEAIWALILGQLTRGKRG